MAAALAGGPDGAGPDSPDEPCPDSSLIAVSAWCLGLHQDLSGLHKPGCQAKLQSLQQFLASCLVQQRTVANLLDALRVDCGQQGCGLILDAEDIGGCCCAAVLVKKVGWWCRNLHGSRCP